MGKIAYVSTRSIYRVLFYVYCSLIPANILAQPKLYESDTITIYHKYYSTTFSKSKHFPVVVKYWLTKAMFDCEHRFKRTNKFKPDPLIPYFTNLDNDYKRSGYDRGHQMDAFDCGCDSTAMAESFYYSNVAPQLLSLNRGSWKRLEEYTHRLVKEYDSVLVWCGSVAADEKYIGRVAVPGYCWKVIYVKKLDRAEAYSFRNDSPSPGFLRSYEVSLDSIQHITKVLFFWQ